METIQEDAAQPAEGRPASVVGHLCMQIIERRPARWGNILMASRVILIWDMSPGDCPTGAIPAKRKDRGHARLVYQGLGAGRSP